MLWLVVLILLIMGWIMWTQLIGSGWGPTPTKKVIAMLEMSNVTSSDVIYDLGCGDGRIIAEAAERFGARAVGIEADPIRFLWASVTVRIRGVHNLVRVVHGNFFHVDLHQATVVTLFLQQGTNQRLKSKLLAELKPRTRVVTYTWTFDEWHPVLSDLSNQIYVYEIGVSDKPT